jgi:glycosyltransferase involved in cell wall biosynthesis
MSRPGPAGSGRRGIALAYSIADQNFAQTKSLGILNLSMQLARALSSRAEIERFEVLSNSSLDEWNRALGSAQVQCFDRAMASRLGRIVWDQTGAYAAAARLEADWLMLPKGFASFSRRPPVKVASYVHDTIGDYYRRQYPQAVSRLEAWYFDQSLRATLRHSRLIFTNSGFTRDQLVAICERQRQQPPRIEVAGIGFEAVATDDARGRDRIVVLASPWPHKRTDLAVQFMRRWQERTHSRQPVHWVGRFPHAVSQPSIDGWIYHPRLDDPSYHDLLRRARAVVYFSEYEGFGMPPVEAVLFGACPVYSDLPATRETMHGAGAPFDTRSYDSFDAAMTAALDADPADLGAAARDLLARHNWNAVAQRVVSALADCAFAA